MVRRSSRLFAVLGALLMVAVVAPAASGDPGFPPDKQGWWTVATAPVPPVVPIGGATSGAPDVAPGDLYVAGAANSAQAVTALRYVVPDGVTIETLTLHATQGSLTFPGTKLRACPLTGDRNFAATEGGPIDDAPAWSCDRAVPGESDPNGAGYRFALGSLVEDGILAIAVVPGGTADRIVLAAPDATSLAVAPGSDASGDVVDDALEPSVLLSPDAMALPEPASPLPDLAPVPVEAPGAAPSPAPHSAANASTAAATPAVATFAEGTGAPSAVGGAALVVVLALAVWWRGRRALDGVAPARSPG